MKLMDQAKLASTFQDLSDRNVLVISGRARENASGTFVMMGGGGQDLMGILCQVAASFFIRYKDSMKEGVSIDDFIEDLGTGVHLAYEELQDKSSYSDYGSMMDGGRPLEEE